MDLRGSEPSFYERAVSILDVRQDLGIEPSLVGISALTARLGHPHRSYDCIQIGGTNGKSSTARFTAAFLRSLGYRVGLFTSPQLIEHRECIEVDGAMVSRAEFAEAVLHVDKAAGAAVAAGECEQVTGFELLTATALWLFARREVDFAVLEVGLGGSWDATSVVDAKVAVITGVALDHSAILGSDLRSIAAEKAAIIKSSSVAIIGRGAVPFYDVFAKQCQKVGAAEPRIAQSEDLPNGLDTGRFPSIQQQNIACAKLATEQACSEPLSLAQMQTALDKTSLPGRFELISKSPLLLIDAAHNPQSAEVLAAALRERYGVDAKSGLLLTFDTLVLAILKDKDAAGIIAALLPLFANVIVTQTDSPRAMPAKELADVVARGQAARNIQVFETVAAAYLALVRQDLAAVVTGSITLAGELKSQVLEHSLGEAPPTVFLPH